ncbi:hypothetical protein ABER61_25220 [Brevibacillus formosus]|uniref:HNH endonuclease n=1 Tax=Brevibacillus formosus TaxID=54913 RepID=A0ABQ0T7A1_9BACL|nr:hypothetical protein [Brevibacillus formosus]MED1956887.1 hypothetical protein [Brevibacillus formosus]PSJ96538.1 hypothetical protein C7R91_12365 [Brevibacillus formosus]GED59196.1 hypothetical protein BFO01nite_33280 [Brevibacillus formosus]
MLNLYGNEKTIVCENCGKDIIKGSEDKGPGIIIILENNQDVITKVIPSCKGQCDDILQQKHGYGGWKDITDFTNPLLFMQNTMAIMNNLHESNISEDAFTKYKEILLTGFQYVLREPTDDDWHEFNMDKFSF